MSRSHFALLGAVVLGLALGQLAPALVPAASAQSAGPWICYVVDRFPDMKDASTWKGSVKAAEGLNIAAPNTEAGTLLSFSYPVTAMGNASGAMPIICVKQ